MSQSSPLKTCHSVVLTGRLSAGGRYEEAIGEDLVFRLDPERLGPNGQLNGWNISLVASRDENHDYIYPARLHFAASGRTSRNTWRKTVR